MTLGKGSRILIFATAMLTPPLAAVISPVPVALVLVHQVGLGVLSKVFIDFVENP